MTDRTFEILKDPDVRKLVADNVENDPVELALSLKCDPEIKTAICTQVKYLQKCRKKLPEFYAAQCVIPPLSYEQASSEATASLKKYTGNLCIDLTCGLGADAYSFSKKFGKVIAVERDPLLAEIARYNFSLLGAHNITVINDSAENFLAGYDGPKAGLIYADPARRNKKGKKVFLVSDCSPDLTELQDKIMSISDKALFKLSPLFDVAEAFNVFKNYAADVSIVSSAGECKEVLVELVRETTHRIINVIPNGDKEFTFNNEDIGLKYRTEGRVEEYGFLLEPDTGFYKGRLAGALFDRYYSETNVFIPSDTGYCFADSIPHGFCGKGWNIDELHRYHPKTLKKILKERKITGICVMKRNFIPSAEEIRKSLAVKEGNQQAVAFTAIKGEKYALFLSQSE